MEKESERKGRGELDLDRVRPRPLPFLADALLTGRQVAMPFSTIFIRNTMFIVINPSIKNVRQPDVRSEPPKSLNFRHVECV